MPTVLETFLNSIKINQRQVGRRDFYISSSLSQSSDIAFPVISLHMLNMPTFLPKDSYTAQEFYEEDSGRFQNILHIIAEAAAEMSTVGGFKVDDAYRFYLATRGGHFITYNSEEESYFSIVNEDGPATLFAQRAFDARYGRHAINDSSDLVTINHRNFAKNELAYITRYILSKLSPADIKLLLTQRDVEGNTPLMLALAAGRQAALGFIQEIYNVIRGWVRTDRQEVLLLKNDAEQTFFHFYAGSRWIEYPSDSIFDWTLDEYSIIDGLHKRDIDGNTPIHNLCKKPSVGTLQAIFYRGEKSITELLNWEAILEPNCGVRGRPGEDPLQLAFFFADNKFLKLFLLQIPDAIFVKFFKREETKPYLRARSLAALIIAFNRLPAGDELKDEAVYVQTVIGPWLEKALTGTNLDLYRQALFTINDYMRNFPDDYARWMVLLQDDQKQLLFRAIRQSVMIHDVCTHGNAQILNALLVPFSPQQRSQLVSQRYKNKYPIEVVCRQGSGGRDMLEAVVGYHNQRDWCRVFSEKHLGDPKVQENLVKDNPIISVKDLQELFQKVMQDRPISDLFAYFARKTWLVSSRYDTRMANFLACLEVIAQEGEAIEILPMPSPSVGTVIKKESEYLQLWEKLNQAFYPSLDGASDEERGRILQEARDKLRQECWDLYSVLRKIQHEEANGKLMDPLYFQRVQAILPTLIAVEKRNKLAAELEDYFSRDKKRQAYEIIGMWLDTFPIWDHAAAPTAESPLEFARSLQIEHIEAWMYADPHGFMSQLIKLSSEHKEGLYEAVISAYHFMHKACTSRRPELVRCLLEVFSDFPKIQAALASELSGGQLPFVAAASYGDTSMLSVLFNHITPEGWAKILLVADFKDASTIEAVVKDNSVLSADQVQQFIDNAMLRYPIVGLFAYFATHNWIIESRGVVRINHFLATLDAIYQNSSLDQRGELASVTLPVPFRSIKTYLKEQSEYLTLWHRIAPVTRDDGDIPLDAERQLELRLECQGLKVFLKGLLEGGETLDSTLMLRAKVVLNHLEYLENAQISLSTKSTEESALLDYVRSELLSKPFSFELAQYLFILLQTNPHIFGATLKNLDQGSSTHNQQLLLGLVKREGWVKKVCEVGRADVLRALLAPFSNSLQRELISEPSYGQYAFCVACQCGDLEMLTVIADRLTFGAWAEILINQAQGDPKNLGALARKGRYCTPQMVEKLVEERTQQYPLLNLFAYFVRNIHKPTKFAKDGDTRMLHFKLCLTAITSAFQKSWAEKPFLPHPDGIKATFGKSEYVILWEKFNSSLDEGQEKLRNECIALQAFLHKLIAIQAEVGEEGGKLSIRAKEVLQALSSKGPLAPTQEISSAAASAGQPTLALNSTLPSGSVPPHRGLTPDSALPV